MAYILEQSSSVITHQSLFDHVGQISTFGCGLDFPFCPGKCGILKFFSFKHLNDVTLWIEIPEKLLLRLVQNSRFGNANS